MNGAKKVLGQLGTIYNTNNFLAKGAPSKINLKCGRPSFPKSFSKYSPHAVTKTLLGGLTKNLIINLLTSRINHSICFEWSLCSKRTKILVLYALLGTIHLRRWQIFTIFDLYHWHSSKMTPYCSDTPSLSHWTSRQSKKEESKLLNLQVWVLNPFFCYENQLTGVQFNQRMN